MKEGGKDGKMVQWECQAHSVDLHAGGQGMHDSNRV